MKALACRVSDSSAMLGPYPWVSVMLLGELRVSSRQEAMPLHPTPKGSSRGLGPSTDGVLQLSPVPQIQSDLRLPELLVPALASGTSVVVAPHVGAHGDVRSPHLHRFSQPTPNKRTQSKKR